MTINFKEYHDELLFVPLGGSNEIGMNLNLYHYQGKWLMVDCGIGFAEPHLPGVEVVVPDIEFIMQRKKDLLGLVLTHAHEDHLGAVPYLWEALGCPIYATAFTASFLRAKLMDSKIRTRVPVKEVVPDEILNLAPFEIDFLGLTHSVPEMQALAIRTPKGVIMHTGDWKFDEDPMVGPASDYQGLKKYGDEGVLALVCDSTNVFVEGESGSEADVRKGLVEAIKSCKGRVAVTTFASNVARIESILYAAQEAGRVVVIAGRAVRRIIEAGRESGYFQDTPELLSEDQAMSLPRSDALIICTGSQGEPLAALTKIARGEHPHVRLSPGDAVIYSSRKIPGNEKKVSYVQNQLVDKGIEVITDHHFHVHVSGHPARGELKRMYELTRPRIAIPTHGEPRHLREHAKFAESLGVKFAVEMRNGYAAQLDAAQPRIIGTVEAGYLAVDGNTLIPTDSGIIRTRRKLRDDGIIFVSLAMDKQGNIVADPVLSTPGVLDAKEDAGLIIACVEAIQEELERMHGKQGREKLQDVIRAAIRRTLRGETDKKPLIEVHCIAV